MANAQARVPGPGGAGSTGGNTNSFAISFNGTSQALNTAENVVYTSTAVASVSFWMKQSGAFNNSDELAGESSTNFNGVSGAFLLDPNAASGFFEANVSTSAGAFVCQITRPASATVWHLYTIVWNVFTNPNTCAIYVDGSSVSTTLIAATGSATFTDHVMYLMSRAASSLWNGGSMAEFAIWKVALNSTDAANLWNGGSGALATTVQGSSLIRYWHGCDTTTDVITGSWVGTGSPTQVAGPGLLNCP